MNNAVGFYDSPIGYVVAEATERGVLRVYFSDDPVAPACRGEILDACLAQIGEYFEGARREFSVPLDLRGTEFQMGVWRALTMIPYGETTSYGRVAAAVGRPRAGRAVGGANHYNPVSIIVPCHRVIGSDGSLVGYGGCLRRKRWLIDHEAKHAGGGENGR